MLKSNAKTVLGTVKQRLLQVAVAVGAVVGASTLHAELGEPEKD